MSEISNSPNIALIGGGTGSFTLLQELKTFTPNISALVNMSDDGGSTGVLRDEHGVLPPGDVRQCLVALSDTPEVRDLFSFRFDEGKLSGHSVGNIVLSALQLQYGNFEKAVEVASRILHTTGKVVPITLDNHVLVMQDGDEIIEGEHKISHRPIQNVGATISLSPVAKLNPEAAEAISSADLLVVAPGNLFGSLLPALATNGVREAFAESKAQKVVISNLVTKPGQTTDWHVVDYIKEIEKYVGRDQIDVALYNSQLPSCDLVAKYAADGEFPVAIDPSRFSEISAEPIGANLVASSIYEQDPSDRAIRRTLIRHNANAVGRKLMSLFYR